jgi:hypothetical protein
VRPPTTGLWHDARHRYFGNYPDLGAFGPLTSVTSAIGILDKPGIAIWRGQTVARTIAEKLPMFTEMVASSGVDNAVKWASSLPDYQRDTAADIGSRIHQLTEQVARGGEPDMTDDERRYVEADMAAHADLGFRPISLEKQVVNLTEGFAGTFDEIAALDGENWMIDRKTWRRAPRPGGDMFAETGMQLAAYAHGEFVGVPDDPKRYRLPHIDRFAVLHLRPELYERGYALYPFDVTAADYAGFLGLLAAHKWKQSRARLLIQEPMQQKEVAAA